MNVDGATWWTTAAAVAQLRVDRKVINQWVRRSRTAGHVAGAAPQACPACGRGGFTHLDPPVRRPAAAGHRGGTAGYRAQQLLDVEAYTAGSPRGGQRRPA